MKIAGIVLLIVSLFVISFPACHSPKEEREKIIASELIVKTDSLNAICTQLSNTIASGDEQNLQKLFLAARIAYKKIEWATEYFEPAASRAINGPPVQEVERSGQVFDPSGLQVIESFLFPHYDNTKKAELQKQLKVVAAACERFKIRFANIDILNWQVFDAAKLEVFRVLSLGISGFDDPLTLNAMQESAEALKAIRLALNNYKQGEDDQHINSKFESAESYLLTHRDFNSFDRMSFILSYGNRLSISISNQQDTLNIKSIRYNRLLDQDAKTLFDTNAFNVNAFAPGPIAFTNPAKVELGRILFADPQLSGNGKRSCQSCHQPNKAFTDGLAKNTMIDNGLLLQRNTPTLINAALQASLFADLRTNTLEDQAIAVVQNVNEMHGSMVLSVKRFAADKKYKKLFAAAFPAGTSQQIDTFEIMNAIGSYVRSLVALNSRFDQYMRGNRNSLNKSEINGFNLFMGKAKCGTCHYMPLFSGTFPPRYMRSEAEVIGVPQTKAHTSLDPDPGRYAIQPVGSLLHSFKTPSIRNISLTAPYMHNGVYENLDEVMEFYEKGGGVGVGLKVENQTLPFDKLTLSKSEREDIIAFMKSL